MPGLFNRLKIWSAGEVLKYSDLNGEFDNILANMESDNIAGWSSSVSQMRIQTNPGSVGTESLASSVSGELERIRYVISRIVGKTYWYDTPDYDLSTLGDSVKSTLGFFLQKDSKKDSIYNYHNFLSDAVVSNGISKGNAKFSSYGLANSPTIASFYPVKENILNPEQITISCWLKNLVAGDGVVCNPLLGIYVYVNGSGLLQADIETKEVVSNAKVVKTVTGTVSVTNINEFRNFLFRCALSSVLGASNDKLRISFGGTEQGTPLTADTINVNYGSNSGSWMFFGKKNPALTTVKFSAFGTSPDLEPSNPWVLTQTGGSHSVSGGVLTLNSATNTTRYFSLASGLLPATVGSGMVLRTKLRITDYGAANFTGANGIITSTIEGLEILLRIDSGDVGAKVVITNTGLNIFFTGFSVTDPTVGIQHDFSQWSVVELIVTSVPALTAYKAAGLVTFANSTTQIEVKINGISKAKIQSLYDTTAGSVIQFGRITTGSIAPLTAELEYFGVYSNGTDFIIPNNTATQYISDISFINQYISSDTFLTTLQKTDPNVVCPLEEIPKKTVFQILAYKPAISYNAYNCWDLSISNATGNEWLFSADNTKNTLKFFSDGVTPKTISVTARLRTSTVSSVVAPAVLAALSFRNLITKAYYSAPNVGTQVSTGTWDELSVQKYTTFPANTGATSQDSLSFVDTRVWPAGEIVLIPVFAMQKIAGSAATSANCFLSLERITIS